MALFVGLFSRSINLSNTIHIIKFIDYRIYCEFDVKPQAYYKTITKTSIYLFILLIMYMFITYLPFTIIINFYITLLFVASTVISYLLFKECDDRHIYLSKNFIEFTSFFFKNTEIRWSDVKKVEFDNKRIILKTIDEVIQIKYSYTNSMIALRYIYDFLDQDKYVLSLQQNEFYKKKMLLVLKQQEKQSLSI